MSKRQQEITDEQFKKLLREISKRFTIAGGVVILFGMAIIALVYLLGGAHYCTPRSATPVKTSTV